MRNAQGYAVWTGPSGPPKECDTFTCSHCNKIVFVPPKADPSTLGGFCRLCMKNICGPCHQEGSCKPFEKKLEEIEARDRMRRAITG